MRIDINQTTRLVYEPRDKVLILLGLIVIGHASDFSIIQKPCGKGFLWLILDSTKPSSYSMRKHDTLSPMVVYLFIFAHSTCYLFRHKQIGNKQANKCLFRYYINKFAFHSCKMIWFLLITAGMLTI